jgi:hypothetical protein
MIESWRVVRETKSGRMSELKVRLSDCCVGFSNRKSWSPLGA